MRANETIVIQMDDDMRNTLPNYDRFVELIDKYHEKQLSLNDIVEKFDQSSADLLVQHIDEEFYRLLETILSKWTPNQSELTEKEWFIFEFMTNLLSKLSDSMVNSLLKHENLLLLLKKSLKNIASSNHHIAQNFTSFDQLIQRIGCLNSSSLIDEIARCAMSDEAAEILSNLKGLPLASNEHFLLVTCPNYVLKYDQEYGKYAFAIYQRMFSIYLHRFRSLPTNFHQYIDCFRVPLQLIAYDISSLSIDEKISLKTVTQEILQQSILNENEIPLILSVLKISREILRSEPKYIVDLRENEKLIENLQNLTTKFDNENLKLQILEMLILIYDEEKIEEMIDIKQMMQIYRKQFEEEEEEEFINGIKDLIQIDLIRREFLDENLFPLLINYAEKNLLDENPLKILFSLLFIEKGKQELMRDEYSSFVEHLRQLKTTDHIELRQVAEGIIWKIDNETKIFGKHRNYTSICQYAANESKSKFDVMISYSWTTKSLCQQLCERLRIDGYKIWFDENEMFGSIVERMAEGIENSEIILICASTGYKQSVNCQAEAEYAFKRKKILLPLIIETKYKPDGWLGFLLGNQLYVNFSSTDFEQSYRMLSKQFEHFGLKQNEILPITTNHRYETIRPIISSSSIRPVKNWNEDDVIQYLSKNNLKKFETILRGINGQGLIELHQLYRCSADQLFKIFTENEKKLSPGQFFRFISQINSLFDE